MTGAPPARAGRDAGGLELATAEDADAIAGLRTAVAAHLTNAHGRGHWSFAVSARGVLHRMRTGKVFVLRRRAALLATLCLTTQRPWSIDPTYFSAARRPLYLVDMAVHPDQQRRGIGRLCLHEATRLARAWPADCIRLDAYDSPAGAGAFYRRCGYREVGRKVYRKVPLVYYELVLDRQRTS